MLVFVTICSLLSFTLVQNEREYRQAQPTTEPKADHDEQSIHLVEWCESWLAAGQPALEVIRRYLHGTTNDALLVSDQALLDTQLALVQALLHPMREFINEHEQPVPNWGGVNTLLPQGQM